RRTTPPETAPPQDHTAGNSPAAGPHRWEQPRRRTTPPGTAPPQDGPAANSHAGVIPAGRGEHGGPGARRRRARRPNPCLPRDFARADDDPEFLVAPQQKVAYSSRWEF